MLSDVIGTASVGQTLGDENANIRDRLMPSPSARSNRKSILLAAAMLIAGTSITFAQGGGAGSGGAGGAGAGGANAGGGATAAAGGTAVSPSPPPSTSTPPPVVNPSNPNTAPQRSPVPLTLHPAQHLQQQAPLQVVMLRSQGTKRSLVQLLDLSERRSPKRARSAVAGPTSPDPRWAFIIAATHLVFEFIHRRFTVTQLQPIQRRACGGLAITITPPVN
jgi:hypothetical protein